MGEYSVKLTLFCLPLLYFCTAFQRCQWPLTPGEMRTANSVKCGHYHMTAGTQKHGIMERTIIERLDRIEQLTLHSLVASKDTLCMDEAVVYTGLKQNYIYNLVHNRSIPHFKSKGGKMLYFDRADLDKWMRAHRVSSAEELAQDAATYVVKKPIRKGGVA